MFLCSVTNLTVKIYMCHFVQSDLKVITDAKGGSFYRDHLPLLGTVNMYSAFSFKIGSIFSFGSRAFNSGQLQLLLQLT